MASSTPGSRDSKTILKQTLMMRFPVVWCTVDQESIEPGLPANPGVHADSLAQCLGSLPNRLDQFFTLCRFSKPHKRYDNDHLSMHVLGKKRQGRGLSNRHPYRHFIRKFPEIITVKPHVLPGIIEILDNQARIHFGADGRTPVFEGGDDAEIAATAADAPEKVLIFICTGGDHFSLGSHNIGRN